MYISLKDFYYGKFQYYAIKKNCHSSFNRHKKSIKESIKKIVDDNKDYLFTESLICYLTDKDLYMKLGELATNDKYLIYELISGYYQVLIRSFNYSSVDNRMHISENDLTKYLDLETIKVLTEMDLLFIKICRMNDLGGIYYFTLMKLIIFYITTYCHINACMDKYDSLIEYYKNDIYKIKDEITMNGLDITDTNNELIDIVSSGIKNKNKKLIK